MLQDGRCMLQHLIEGCVSVGPSQGEGEARTSGCQIRKAESGQHPAESGIPRVGGRRKSHLGAGLERWPLSRVVFLPSILTVAFGVDRALEASLSDSEDIDDERDDEQYAHDRPYDSASHDLPFVGE